MLGLPDSITACLFDMDGVLTETATVHAAAWKETFDALLQERADRDHTPFVPFDIATDYVQYVDGRKREDGVRTFLASRDITLPEGDPGDPPGHDTVWAVGNAKNRLVLKIIDRDGVLAFPGSVRYLHAVRAAGLATAVVSASANAEQVLQSAGIVDLFDARVDGVVAGEQHLAGKPAPDTFLAAARMLGVEPAHATVFEDALSGVSAGHSGHFGFVVGVNRTGQAQALREHGADIVVDDLADLVDGAGS